ncbi:MAG: gliding motility-associated C-terminal domain-containing protein, partial [Calditrichia bacterium]
MIHSGIYEITVTNQCGTTGDAIAITFEKCGAVYLPNVFSPNGDGVNDYFFVQASPQVERVISLKIFDRWGGLIFEATNFTPNDRGYGWDGSFNNKKIDIGVYL